MSQIPLTPKPVTIWIVEDNLDYGEQLAEELNQDDSIECTHHFGSYEEALVLLDSGEMPGIVMIDLNLPGKQGIEAIKEIKLKFPAILCLVLTVSGQRRNVFDALRAGAAGYLLKSEPLENIVTHIHEVVDGGAPLSSTVTPFVLDTLRIRQPAETEGLSLSERESEILGSLADGCSRTEIGVKLCIATVTVDYHLRGLFKKLGTRSMTGTVAKAFRLGLLK